MTKLTEDTTAALYNELHPLSPHSQPWLVLTAEQQQAVRNVSDQRFNDGFDEGEAIGRESLNEAVGCATGALSSEIASLQEAFDNLKTVIDEQFGMQPVMTPDEAVSFLDQEITRRNAARDNREAELRSRITKLAESLHNASGNPFITGVDDRLLKHVSEKLRELGK